MELSVVHFQKDDKKFKYWKNVLPIIMDNFFKMFRANEI